jgi:hypothetical protein
MIQATYSYSLTKIQDHATRNISFDCPLFLDGPYLVHVQQLRKKSYTFHIVIPVGGPSRSQ